MIDSMNATARFFAGMTIVSNESARPMTITAAAALQDSRESDEPTEDDACDDPKPASPSRQKFAIVAVPVHAYDFKRGVAEIGSSDSPIKLPLVNLVTFCTSNAPGAGVAVDGVAQGILLFSTEEWSLVTPSGHTTPVVV